MANSFTDGAAYERLMGRWSKRAAGPFLDWLAPEAGLDWIDIGCGNGAFSEEIATRCAPRRLLGVDPSPQQISYARSRLEAEFQVGGAEQLDVGDASFDMATMALVIAFVPEPAAALREMARVLRPGGMAAAYMWDLPGGGVPLWPLYRACRQLGLQSPMPPSAAVSAAGEMQALWVGAGLQEVGMMRIDITVSFASFAEFWDSNAVAVGPLGPVLAQLDAAGTSALQDVVRGLVPPAADGSISYGAFANAVKGRVPTAAS